MKSFHNTLKQKITDDRKRLTAVPFICTDENFNFPLPIISKVKGIRWSAPNEDEEISFGDVTVTRKHFGNFKDRYLFCRQHLKIASRS